MGVAAATSAVNLRHVACTRCGFEFYTPVAQRRLCTDCQQIPPAQRRGGPKRNRIDPASEGYRWAHAVTNQRMAIELARLVLGAALRRESTDARFLRGAMQIALDDLNATIDPVTNATRGSRVA